MRSIVPMYSQSAANKAEDLHLNFILEELLLRETLASNVLKQFVE